MSILTPPATTPAQKAANNITRIIQNSYAGFTNSIKTGLTILWNNPEATPQDIATALGTSGVEILQLAELAATTIQSAATIDGAPVPAISITNSNYSITMNGDGSVTIALIEAKK